jgi:hypothetical protein
MNDSCSFFSHGIVAFNGWPLNVLRRDDHHEKGERACGKIWRIGKNTREKVLAENPLISRRKRAFAIGADEKTSKKAYISVLEKLPAPRKTPGKLPHFDTAAAKKWKKAPPSYTRRIWRWRSISSKATSGPRLQPGQWSAVSSHASGEFKFESQNGHVRHWLGRAS